MDFRFRSAHISTTISISLVLFLVGITMVMLFNAKHLSASLREHIGLSILLENNAQQAEVLKLKKELELEPYILSAEYVSNEVAAARLAEKLGKNFVEVLGYNPLPSSIDIRIKAAYTSTDSITVIENRVKAEPFVKGVHYPKNIISSLSDNIRKISFMLLLFAALLLLVTIGLINNSVRIAIYADRFLIRTQELVGATQLFISKPYLLQSILQGIIGGLVAIALITAFILLIQNNTSNLLDTSYLLIVYGSVLLFGVTITTAASLFAVRKYMNVTPDQLYR